VVISVAAAGSLALAVSAAGQTQVATAYEQAAPRNVSSIHAVWQTENSPASVVRQAIVDNENAGSDDSASGSAGGGPALSDEQFLMTALAKNATEVEAGRLAQSRAESEAVRQFADALTRDRQAALDDATQVADDMGVSEPQIASTNDQRALLTDLSALSGAEFDRTFMRAMILDHKTDIAEYTRAATDRSGEVSAYAQRQLPALRDQLIVAQEVAGSIGVDISGQ